MRVLLEKQPHTFNPETVAMLCEALDDALQRVQSSDSLTGQSSVPREALAKCLVDAAKEGERDQQRLVEKALLRLKL